MHRTIDQAKLPAALARAAIEELRYRPDQHRFAQTFCSQCGADQGPGDSGVSHCSDHLSKIVKPYGRTERLQWPAPLPTGDSK